MSQTKNRKLTGLALCNLLLTKDAELLKYLGQIINACLTAMQYARDIDDDLDGDEYVNLFKIF